MGLIRWLDDLDTRVIGRGDPNWRWPTPKPWTPEIRPLIPLRRSHVLDAWVCAPGVAACLLIIVFSGDYFELSVSDVLAYGVAFVLLALLNSRLQFSRSLLDGAQPVPPDVPVERSQSVLSAMSIIRAVALLVMILVVFALDPDDAATTSVFYMALLLGFSLGFVFAGRKLARWEDEHGVEVLRARWRRSAKGLYVRPQAMPNRNPVSEL
jgi:hypothetical protein